MKFSMQYRHSFHSGQTVVKLSSYTSNKTFLSRCISDSLLSAIFQQSLMPVIVRIVELVKVFLFYKLFR